MPRCLKRTGCIGLLIAQIFLQALGHAEQSIQFEGYVVDSQTGQPIEEVAVRLTGTIRGTSTDTKGQFLLGLTRSSHVLSFSRIGYVTQTRSVDISHDSISVLRVALMPQVLRMQGIDVLSRSSSTRFEELQEFAGTLRGEDLERSYSLTLAETLRNEVGVGIRSMGPAPARPVIRGLSGDRIQITQDGMQTRDLSSTSADHAVTLEMFNLDRIEIIRGPRTLLHCSSVSGGVINIVKNKIPESRPSQVFGNVGFRATTVDQGMLAAGSVVAPVGPLGFFGETTYRATHDQTTPIGKLENTSINTTTLITGISYAGDRGYAGASFDQFDTEYGIPGGFIGSHPNGADIDIVRRVFDAKASYEFDGPLDRLETSFVRTFYHHFEFESNGNIGSEFLFHDYSGETRLHFGKEHSRSKTVLGVNLNHHELELGAFVFTPPTKLLTGSISAYHETSRNRFELQIAARYACATFDPKGGEGEKPDRTFHSWSAAVSPLLSISDQLVSGISISRSERIPTIEELYNDGPHLAAYTYEIGDATLRSERNIGLEAFLHFRKPGFDFLVTGFLNEYSNYLTPRNTGDINFTLLLPIFVIDGVGARFVGVESRLSTRQGDHVRGEVSVSYVRAHNSDDNLPVPELPPLKATGSVEYRHSWLTVGATAEVADRQARVDAFEIPTDGYATFGLYAQKDFVGDHLRHSLTFELDNLANREYRNHLSRVRSVMPESGRSLRINYKVHYF